jgi:hypothetical protein
VIVEVFVDFLPSFFCIYTLLFASNGVAFPSGSVGSTDDVLTAFQDFGIRFGPVWG